MEMTNQKNQVCVTGASGYIGSWLVKKLLENGYTVHATLRNLAAVAGLRLIAESCIRSQTVKRLIYTASVMASSQLIGDGNRLWSCVDESCWTPLDHSFICGTDFTMGYTRSKTLAEQEVLRYNELENCKLEVVTLACGVVGGDTLLPCLPLSLEGIFSQLNGNSDLYNALKFVQEITGSIPLVHIEDVCQAHIFCMERPSMRGRFFCAVANPTLKGIGFYFQENFKEYKIAKELLEGPERGTTYDFTKLIKMGFEYKYDMKKILDHSVGCGRRFGAL